MPNPQLTIAQGKLKGCAFTTQGGFKYCSYTQIPYAKPPVGELRFRDPVPADGWDGVRDATEDGEVCPQFDRIVFQKPVGDEDSLFLNVYSPAEAIEGDDLPVMMWIHGGGYVLGSGRKLTYGPDYLVQNNVVIVTINFRLGAFGFLCLHTPEVPGNAGLKDQVMALRWIQENIGKFGGDRNNVTIFGESTGSTSVQYMMLSKMADGLFHRAIMQSGSCLSFWAYRKHSEESSAFELAKKLGLNSNDKAEILKFLQDVPQEDLVRVVEESFKLNDAYHFLPVLEKHHPGVEAFITTPQLELLVSGDYRKVPTMIGITSQEGVLLITKRLFGSIDMSESTRFEDHGLDVTPFFPEELKSAKDKIQSFYFKSDRPDTDGYIDLLSDFTFNLCIDRSIKIMSQHGQEIYFYLFDYNGSLNLFKSLVNYNYSGASHGDELPYIFHHTLENFPFLSELNPTADDNLLIKRLAEMWTNFAKTGKPTVKITDVITTEWKPVTANKMYCLKIGKDLQLITDPLSNRIKFWETLPQFE